MTATFESSGISAFDWTTKDMGLWIDILRLGGEGRWQEAHIKLNEELPLALRRYVSSEEKSLAYRGPVPEAVARFVNRRPSGERAIAKFHEYDLVDYIVDSVTAGVGKTLQLVRLCFSHPEASLDEFVDSFPWETGLNRSREQKRKWIADHLRSMLSAEVSLPQSIGVTLGDEGKAEYEFDEIKYAVSNRRLELSWMDFKRQQDLDVKFAALVDVDAGESPADEAADFSSVSIASVVLSATRGPDHELMLDLHRLGKRLGPEVAQILEQMHGKKPTQGYQPIAWHNVFWRIVDDYEAIRISLKTLPPECETDQSLADHIAENYREVRGCSRPVIYRRRTELHQACERLIRAELTKLCN